MASVTNDASPPIDVYSAQDVVLTTGELILMILGALDSEEVDSSWGVHYNRRLYKCMLVNRTWCEWSRRLLWREPAWPQAAFDAVLRQFDVEEVGGHIVSLEDRVVKRPREAYVRYCYYASMVESIKNWNSTKNEDEDFCAKLDLFDLRHNVFPRLKKLRIMPRDDAFWFPLCFRNHSVTELSIMDAPGVRGVVRGVSQYCPRLERLTVSGQLHGSEVDLLQVHRFIYLTNLSIYVDQLHPDNFMRIILFISFNLTDLTLIFPVTIGIDTPRRGKSFNSLKHLTLQGSPAVAYSLDKLPSAPQLESLHLTSLWADIDQTNDVSRLFTAVAEYAKQSPFTKLFFGNGHFNRIMYWRVDISLVILSEIDRLTDLTFAIGATSRVLFPDGRPMLWRHLRNLNLTLGHGTTPGCSLEHFLRIVSQAPHLTDAAALMDLRASHNPALRIQAHPTGEKAGSILESNLLESSFQTIGQFRTTSLRNLSFNMSHLRYGDQGFLFCALRDFTPNLGMSTVTLGSLYWHSSTSRDTAIQCAKAQITSKPLSAVEFAVLLRGRSDFAM